MAIDQESFNKKLYDLLKTKGYRPIPKDTKNKRTENPQEADVFNFTFTKNGEEITDAWVTIDDAQDLIVYYDDEVLDSGSRSKDSEFDDSWIGFIQQLKRWAMGKQLGFELREKHKLGDDMAQREYTRKKENVNEGYYPMGKQSSYNDNVPTVKIVLQHTRQIQEGEQRFRNIARIYLENIQGERILAPTVRPGIAQVYARHLAEGGLPNDERWNHIKSLCEEYNKMAGFVRATRNKQFNESAQSLINEGVNHYHNLRETLGKMRSNRGYHKYFESFTPVLNEESTDNTSLNELFVQETLDPRIESVLPILSKLHKKIDEIKETVELEEWAQSITELKQPNKITMDQYLAARKKIQQVQMLLHAEPNQAKKEQMKKLLAKKLAMLKLSAEESGLDINEDVNPIDKKKIEKKIDDIEDQLKDPLLDPEKKKELELELNVFQTQLKNLNTSVPSNAVPQVGSDADLSVDSSALNRAEIKTPKDKVEKLKKKVATATDTFDTWLKVNEDASEEYADQIIDSIGYEGVLGNLDGNKIYRAVEEYQKMMDNPADLDVDEVVEIIVDRLDVRHLGEEQEEKFVIVSTVEKDDETGKPLYWNNDDGWTIKKGATEFSSDEVKRFKDIPMNSKWVKLSGIKENLGPEQKRVGQLGPTEKVGKKGAVGKLVGASESVENPTMNEDSDEARELELFATNDSDLYRQSYLPIVKNLERKFKKGVYDKELAKKLWVLHAARAAKKYGQEHSNDDGLKIFSTAVRREVAEKLRDDHFAEMEAGNFHDLPFSGGKPAKGTIVDKSGAKHSPMSRAKDLAQKGKDSVKEELDRILKLSGK